MFKLISKSNTMFSDTWAENWYRYYEGSNISTAEHMCVIFINN